jgi:hypothetical protein
MRRIRENWEFDALCCKRVELRFEFERLRQSCLRFIEIALKPKRPCKPVLTGTILNRRITH